MSWEPKSGPPRTPLTVAPSFQPPELSFFFMEDSVVYTGWCRDLVEVVTEQMAAISLGRLSLVLCLSDCPGHGKTEKEKAGGGRRGGTLGSLWHAGNSPVNPMGSCHHTILSVVHDPSVSCPKCPCLSKPG